MNAARRRLAIAFCTYIAWIVVTIEGAALLHPQARSLLTVVNSRPGWHFLAAIVLLLGVTMACRWRDLGLAMPARPRTWLLLSFPALVILLLLSLAVLTGLPPGPVIGWLLLNTLLIGISEELMFRGVLFAALRQAMSIRRALVVAGVLFGAVHILNGFLTGAFLVAGVQSLTAFMSGMLFLAVVVRTGSLLPAIILHWLWDFSIFCLSAGGFGADGTTIATPLALALPVLLVLPNLLYALHLLRHVGEHPTKRHVSLQSGDIAAKGEL